MDGETSEKLAERIGVKPGGGMTKYFNTLTEHKIHREIRELTFLKKGKNKIWFFPENEELVLKKWSLALPFYAYPYVDFRQDIDEWYDQLSYWDEFFTPWLHSEKIIFNGRLRVESSLSYLHFRKYVKFVLEKNPDFCKINPFDEQSKLKRMMGPFSELRDKLLDEFKKIIDSKMSNIESKLPNFDKNKNHQLLQLIFMRKSHEFLSQQNFDEPYSIVIGMPQNKDTLHMARNKKLVSSYKYKPKDVEEVLDLLSDEIDKSPIITKELMVKLWTMISESQQICSRIMRVLKLFYKIK